MKVPFVDLYTQYLSIKNDIDSAIATTIKNSSYIGASVIGKFEAGFGDYLGINHVVSCANGTDSMEIILKAWGIKEGDEVIVPAHSWISTSEAVGNVGAVPVFVDTEPDYFTIDVSQIEAHINSKTKAIIPVHLYGHPADMPAILKIAGKYGLKVLEDCAQAHGASINGRKVGSFGDAASFSFYPGKNLGAYGDAGCMVTNDSKLAELLRVIANHGQKGKHNHLIEGRNSRLDGLQAAILLAKLPYLEEWTAARIAHAKAYNELIMSPDIILPGVREGCRHVYHLYVIRAKERNALKAILSDNAVETAIHYPLALPFLPCYSQLNNKPADFKVAKMMQESILSIPMFAELSKDQLAFVAALLN